MGEKGETFDAFLADLYANLPVLVVRLSSDGMVLGVNPAVTEVTGYAPTDLIGRNWWGLLFPGKLFAQVPRFISPTSLQGLLRDYPMTLRTHKGDDRVVAWTRFCRELAHGRKEIVLIGQDLTDRLTDADLNALAGVADAAMGPDMDCSADALPSTVSDNGIVMPLAASPPTLQHPNGHAKAIEDAYAALGDIGAHAATLDAALPGEGLAAVSPWVGAVRTVAQPGDLVVRADTVQGASDAVLGEALQATQAQINDLLDLCRKARPEEK